MICKFDSPTGDGFCGKEAVGVIKSFALNKDTPHILPACQEHYDSVKLEATDVKELLPEYDYAEEIVDNEDYYYGGCGDDGCGCGF